MNRSLEDSGSAFDSTVPGFVNMTFNMDHSDRNSRLDMQINDTFARALCRYMITIATHE